MGAFVTCWGTVFGRDSMKQRNPSAGLFGAEVGDGIP
jgi:hypothetical protein